MIRILKYGEIEKEKIFERNEKELDVSLAVGEIIKNVKERGDAALFEYTEKFDGAALSALEVTEAEIEEAFSLMDNDFVEIIREAAKNIEAFHKKQIKEGFEIKRSDGVVIGQKVTPIEKVGLYVPGGTAAYPSTVLMDSIPAKLAGCREIVITTPPMKNGKVNPAILTAAKIAGVTRIFKLGGAQAIGALAYGTETLPRVDKIVGPGNAYVAEAKRQVFGRVSIDMIAGPSEILVIADAKSNPKYVACDLLSQAEHDRMASAVLVTDSMELAYGVQREIEEELKGLSRCDIARASIENNGKIIVADTIDEVIDVANEIAPEHLEICLDNPFDYLDKIKNAGSIFMGRYCPEALGDYFAGPNHTLPTSGTARFSSPLSVDDFVKKSQFTYYTKEALEMVAGKVARFANEEGLSAHARSATVRVEK